MNRILALLSVGLFVSTPIVAADCSADADSAAQGTGDKDGQGCHGRYQKVDARIFKDKLQASDLTSATVLNQEGKVIGSIIDLEFNSLGRISAMYVELNDGLFCLFGNTIVRMDFDSFEMDPVTGKLYIKESHGQEFRDFVASINED